MGIDREFILKPDKDLECYVLILVKSPPVSISACIPC